MLPMGSSLYGGSTTSTTSYYKNMEISRRGDIEKAITNLVIDHIYALHEQAELIQSQKDLSGLKKFNIIGLDCAFSQKTGWSEEKVFNRFWRQVSVYWWMNLQMPSMYTSTESPVNSEKRYSISRYHTCRSNLLLICYFLPSDHTDVSMSWVCNCEMYLIWCYTAPSLKTVLKLCKWSH